MPMYNLTQYSDTKPNLAVDHQDNIIDFSANNNSCI